MGAHPHTCNQKCGRPRLPSGRCIQGEDITYYLSRGLCAALGIGIFILTHMVVLKLHVADHGDPRRFAVHIASTLGSAAPLYLPPPISLLCRGCMWLLRLLRRTCGKKNLDTEKDEGRSTLDEENPPSRKQNSDNEKGQGGSSWDEETPSPGPKIDLSTADEDAKTLVRSQDH